MPQSSFDCCIIGGGMIGAAMALGLSKQSYKVALIEKDALLPYSHQQSPDIRLSALNMSSVALLRSMGAWQYVENMRHRPYDCLRVWDGETTQITKEASGQFQYSNRAVTTFKACDVNQTILGHFVENRVIQLALYDEMTANYADNVHCIVERNVSRIDVQEGVVELDDGHVLTAKLIVGADGAQSQVRHAAGIPASGWQYNQRANAILIKTDVPVPSETWQAFYATGPRALLPMHDNYACLVWYHNAMQSDWIKHAHFPDLKVAIINAFPNLLGEFDIIEVAGFGLTRMHAGRYGQDKAVIIGDAAHTINPLAGQGVNLGFKDVAALLKIVESIGIDNTKLIIHQLEQKRKLPNLAMMSAMDVFYQGFSSSFLPIKIARGLGLTVANRAGPIKNMALKYAMGLA